MSPPPTVVSSPVRCLVLPRPLTENPYQALLHEQLAALGVEFVTARRTRLRWILRTPRVDVVHLHWVEYLTSSRTAGARGTIEALLRSLRLVIVLAAMRARGVAVVWTVHNIKPHRPTHPRVQQLAARAVAALASTLHVHSQSAADVVHATFGRVADDKVLVAYHGLYDTSYEADPRPLAEVRKRLAIPESALLMLMFGSIRPNKHVEDAILAFKKAAPPQAVLLVVGRADEETAAAVRTAASGDPRVRLHLVFVSDDEVGTMFAAADVMILNYSEVFSSGALLLALTFGLPVIAPAAGTAAEIINGGGILFEGGRPGLEEAIEAAAEADLETMADLARRAGQRFHWEEIAGALRAAYSRG